MSVSWTPRRMAVVIVGLAIIGATPLLGAARSAARSATRTNAAVGEHRKHEFYFTRIVYSSGGMMSRFGGGGGRFGSWATDYPKADEQFLEVLGRLARELDSYPHENAVRLTDPVLRNFPFIYAVEVGHMNLPDSEVEALRGYLLAGGFLIVDDFWGSYEWASFEQNIKRVLPEYEIVDMPMDHPIFHSYYEIEKIEQVPNIGNGCRGGPYYERDGTVPMVRGIFDEHKRLMVVISWNSDLGDAWEWMEQACYPLAMSTYAYQIAVNTIVYAMSH